jgi:hypothetical protein
MDMGMASNDEFPNVLLSCTVSLVLTIPFFLFFFWKSAIWGSLGVLLVACSAPLPLGSSFPKPYPLSRYKYRQLLLGTRYHSSEAS